MKGKPTEIPDVVPVPLRSSLTRILERNGDPAFGTDAGLLTAQLEDWATFVGHPGFADLPADYQAIALGDFGTDYLRRYHVEHRPEDLAAARELVDRAIDGLADDPGALGRYLVNRAGITLEAATADAALEAVQLLERAVALAATAELRASRSGMLVHAARVRYSATEQVDDLARVATAAHEAFRYGHDWDQLALALKAASALAAQHDDAEAAVRAEQWTVDWRFETWAGGGPKEFLDQAIEACRATAAASPDPRARRWATDMLVALLSNDARTSGDLAAIDEAVRIAHEHLRSNDSDSLSRLATVLLDRYDLFGENERTVDDVAEAVDLLRRAVARAETELTEQAFRANLASALHTLAWARADDRLLDEAVDEGERALEMGGDEPLLEVLNILSNALATRFRRSRNADDLTRSVALGRRAVDELDPASPLYGGTLANYANKLELQSQLSGDAAELDTVFDAYRAASQPGVGRSARATLDSAGSWGRLATLHRRWEDAALAYRRATDAAAEVLAEQAVLRHERTVLEGAQGVARGLATALLELGDTHGALEALETARSRLFAERLEILRGDVDRLDASGHGDLADAFREAVREARDGSRQGHAAAAHRARDRRDEIVARIRALPGFEEFLVVQPIDDAMSAVANGFDVLHVAPGLLHGNALWATGDGRLLRVALPDLHDEWCREAANALLGATDAARVAEVVDAIGSMLWKLAVDPVLAARGRPERPIAVVAHGLLALLPLHAAWRADDTAPSGRRYFIDESALTFVPSARALAVAMRRAADDATLLAVEQPEPVAEETLPAAPTEVAAVCAHFATTHRIAGSLATRRAVLDALSRNAVAHFACHGEADVRDPLLSYLVMAYDERLTLADIVWSEEARGRLAVLSACKSGVAGPFLPDEAISFPTVLLHAGYSGAIGSLWSVPDGVTALLMARFYDEWRREGHTPPDALRRAQQWVRDADGAEKAQRFPDIVALMQADGDDLDHAHPWLWAGFTYNGC